MRFVSSHCYLSSWDFFGAEQRLMALAQRVRITKQNYTIWTFSDCGHFPTRTPMSEGNSAPRGIESLPPEINTCQLWSPLTFDRSERSLEKSTVWLARSKDAPLSILVDLPDGEGEIVHISQGASDISDRILELIFSHTLHWKIFSLHVLTSQSSRSRRS